MRGIPREPWVKQREDQKSSGGTSVGIRTTNFSMLLACSLSLSVLLGNYSLLVAFVVSNLSVTTT
jgi:hypothetical protein